MKGKIFLKTWLGLKPYKSQSDTDSYYLKVCNDLKKLITSKEHSEFGNQLTEEGIDLLCCFLVSYFEDLISETNIWATFVKIHQKLYRKKLPFYNTDNYVEKKINHQDIRMLIWYFLNTLHNNVFIDPHHHTFNNVAQSIFKLFDEKWENSPKNERLKSCYQIDENEEDFYVARKLIDTLLFETYLFTPDTRVRLKEKEKDTVRGRENDKNVETLIYDNRDMCQHRLNTRLLGLSGKEWVAEILGKEHPLHQCFKGISKKIQGWFLYQGQDDQHFFIEHISSGKKFNVLKASINNLKAFDKENALIFIGIVKWKGEWWFSGVFLTNDYDSDLVAKEKNSIASRAALSFLDLEDDKKTNEMLDEQLKSFKIYNHGSQIAFLPSDKINEFYKNYIEFYKNTLDLSEEEKVAARDRIRAMKNSENFEDQELTEISETGLAFFNPKSGGEIAMHVNSAFPSSSNPFFKKENSKDHVLRLLTSADISTELFLYCIENHKNELSIFQEDPGKKYLEDIDFFLRFWKKEHYHTISAFANF